MAVERVTDEQFEVAIQKPKVIVKYYADWCGSCRLVAPKYKRLADDARFADVVFLEVNAEENEKARKAGSVSNLPFFATFHNGELKAAVATSKEEAIVEMIEQLN